MGFEKALGSVVGSGGDAIIDHCDFQEKSWLKTELYRWNPLNKGQYRGKAEKYSEPVETACSAPRNRMKIQSDLHGNMQRLVEIPSPLFIKNKSNKSDLNSQTRSSRLFARKVTFDSFW